MQKDIQKILKKQMKEGEQKMAHPELYLILNDNQKIIFAIAMIAIVILVQIVAKMKNKAQKRTSKQITCQRPKNVFSIDYDEFVNANFEKVTYLYENKNRVAELVRLVG